jgi:DNA-binding winged helix-turn-helix (wHTH) protein/Tol biopolymer transport system component
VSLDLPSKIPQFNLKGAQNGHSPVYSFADFELRSASRLLLKDGRELPVTPKAVETLIVLVDRQGEVVSKDELMEKVWRGTVVEESNLHQYLHLLRKTLGNLPDGRPFIETLRRRGYRFNGDVVKVEKGVGRTETASADGYSANGFHPETSFALRSLLGNWSVTSFLLIVLFSGVALIGWIFLGGSRPAVAPAPRVPNGDPAILALTNGENVTETTISRDGRYLAYVDYDGDTSQLRVEDMEKAGGADVIPPLAGRIGNLTISPDGNEIYYVIFSGTPYENKLYRVPVTGGVPTKIVDNIDQPVSFSPDGLEIAFVRKLPDPQSEVLVIAAADGSKERIALERPGDARLASNASWSPDGSLIAFGTNTQSFPIVCSLVSLNLKSGSIAPLSDEKWDSCYRTVWTRDAAGIVFIGTKHGEAFTTRRDQVFFLERQTTVSRLITNDGNWHEINSLGITDDDKVVALPFNRVSQLWMLPASGDTRRAQQITQGQSDGRGGIVPRHDGKIDFLARDGDGFAIFETDQEGVERRQLAGGPTMQELRAPPTGEFFVFSEFAGKHPQIFRIDENGAGRQQLTFSDTVKIDSAVSPDGKYVVYDETATAGTGFVHSLQRIPSSGGTPEKIFDGYCGVPHFSLDGSTISCSSPDKIQIISSVNGALLSEFEPENDFISNSGVRWSPDGKNLVYRVVKHATTNLWRQPINGGRPSPITRFTKGDIYNFAFDPQGSKLFLARGSQIRNAIIIKNFR